MAKKYTNATFVGCDLSEAIIERAKKTFANPNTPNLSYEVQDIAKLPSDWTETFDVVFTRDVIHDVPHAAAILKEVQKIMKKYAIFVMVDIFSHSQLLDNKSLPMASVMYGASLFNCLPQSMNGEKPAGLGTMWGPEKAEELLKAAGFTVEPFEKYESFMIFVCRKK